MFTRTKKSLVTLFSAVLLVALMLVCTTSSTAPAASTKIEKPTGMPLESPQEAATAGSQPTRLKNYRGSPVDVFCNYGQKKKSGTIYEVAQNGKPHTSTKFCKIDVDEWSQKDRRCFDFVGPKYKDGYYWVNPGRFKMSGFAFGGFYEADFCKGKKVVGTWTLK